jgi:hypothetical protein
MVIAMNVISANNDRQGLPRRIPEIKLPTITKIKTGKINSSTEARLIFTQSKHNDKVVQITKYTQNVKSNLLRVKCSNCELFTDESSHEAIQCFENQIDSKATAKTVVPKIANVCVNEIIKLRKTLRTI